MIPDDLDDGFSIELPATQVVCRPMLWAQHQMWKELAGRNPAAGLRVILREPYAWYVNHPDDDESKEIVQSVMRYTRETEQKDMQDLADSASLQATNPGMSQLQCSDCRMYSVDHETGAVQAYPNGMKKSLPKGCPIPCEVDWLGCVKGHHTNPRGLTNHRWAKTWRHFWRYRNNPTERLGSDPIFVRNRMILTWIVDYGRDPRFDPFAGSSSSRGTTTVASRRSDGSDEGGENCPGGSPTSGTCSS